jgi:hypothetical protein
LVVASVEGVLNEMPAMPMPKSDVAQDDAGYSVEVSVDRTLAVDEYEVFSDACLRMAPVVRVDGEHEVRGLVSVDEDTLWVYVHEVGPESYGPVRERAALDLLEDLWRGIHEAAATG